MQGVIYYIIIILYVERTMPRDIPRNLTPLYGRAISTSLCLAIFLPPDRGLMRTLLLNFEITMSTTLATRLILSLRYQISSLANGNLTIKTMTRPMEFAGELTSHTNPVGHAAGTGNPMDVPQSPTTEVELRSIPRSVR